LYFTNFQKQSLDSKEQRSIWKKRSNSYHSNW